MLIYLDSLLFHAALLDSLLLLLLAELFQLRLRPTRFIAALLLAVSYILPEVMLASSIPRSALRILWPLGIAGLAFGFLPLQRLAWLFCGWHLAAAATAGAGRMLGYLFLALPDKLQIIALPSWLPPLLLLSALRIGAELKKLWQRRLRLAAKTHRVEIGCAMGSATVTALWDSGNLLRDTESGLAVLIVHRSCFKEDHARSGAVMPEKARLLPYRTLGRRQYLTVIHPEYVFVNDVSGVRKIDCLLGLCDDVALLGEDFQAILPASWSDSVSKRNGGDKDAESADRKSLESLL